MLIFDENCQPIVIDNIHTPTISTHMWVLDFSIMDYTLAPLLVFEEMICNSLQLRIKGFEFVVPAGWNILVYDSETSQLDVVEIKHTAGKEFTAVVYGHNKANVQPGQITVTNYYNEYTNVMPSLNKHQMLCHPIGPTEWINIAPSDTYNKYLKDCTIGDIT